MGRPCKNINDDNEKKSVLHKRIIKALINRDCFQDPPARPDRNFIINKYISMKSIYHATTSCRVGNNERSAVHQFTIIIR